MVFYKIPVMKKALKIMIWIIALVILLFGSFILYITLVDYQPKKVEKIFVSDEKISHSPIHQDTFDIISWNIGYAGLGAEMDFFYDGGKKVRPSKTLGRKYLDGIKSFMETQNPDFWILQEVDVKAKRSHKMNEVDEIEKLLTDYHHAFAINYKVPFVPVPVYEPMGQVKGGVLNLSKFTPAEVVRFAYPLIASWPNRLFLLDRCFILSRIPLDSGKELVIINTHNSAYVYDSVLRNKELQIIKNKMIDEFSKGNFVIAGGDWNANPPNFKSTNNFDGHLFEASQVKMNPELMPEEWHWTFDTAAPTNRNNDKAFVKGENGTTVLDYFIVSPNIEILKVETIDLNFENSDHNPVQLKFKLNF